MRAILEKLKTIDRYFFAVGSPTTLGVFRIMIGSMALINLLMLSKYWETWFSETGYVPLSTNQIYGGGDPYLWYHGKEAPFYLGGNILPRISLLSISTNVVFDQVFFWLIALAAILTALGLWTRVSTFALAVGTVSLHHRNIMLLHGGDTVLRVMSLYLALSPCGAACSVDRLIAIWKNRAEFPALRSLWVQRLITYNLALLYLTTVWIRMYGHKWKDGTATWYTMRLAEFYRFPYPDLFKSNFASHISTHYTLLVEFTLGTLVFFRPVRKYALIGGILLHAGIEYTMNIPLFGYLMTSMYVCFYEGEEVTAWFRRLGKKLSRFKVTLSYPGAGELSGRSSRILNAIDPLGLVEYVPGNTTEFSARRADGSHIGASWAIVSRSLGAWPLILAPWAWRSLLGAFVETP